MIFCRTQIMWKSCSPIFTVYQRSTAQFWGEGNLSLHVSPLAPLILHANGVGLGSRRYNNSLITARAKGKRNSLAKSLRIAGTNPDPCPHHQSQPEHWAGPLSCQGSLSHLPLSRPTPKPGFATSGGSQVPSSFRMGKHSAW